MPPRAHNLLIALLIALQISLFTSFSTIPTSTPPITYQILDLYGQSECILHQSTTWSVSNPIDSPVLTSTCDGKDVLGGLSIFRDLFNPDNYFLKTYTNINPDHDHILFAFSLYAIDRWADATNTLPVIEILFDTNQVYDTPYINSYPSNLCGDPSLADSYIRIFGKASHYGDSVTVRIGTSETYAFSVGSFAIRDLSLLFVTAAPSLPVRLLQGDSGMGVACGKGVGFFQPVFDAQECPCPENEYYGDGCEACDDSCKSCGASSTECYECNDGYAFDGTNCVSCDPQCKTCSFNPSYCTSCTDPAQFAFQGSCISSCPLPLIPISQGCPDQCISPCTSTQIAFPNGYCDDPSACAFPLTTSTLGDFQVCISPCDPSSTEPYLDSTGTCWAACPSGTTYTLENGIKWCMSITKQVLDLYGPSKCVSLQSMSWLASSPTDPSVLTTTCHGDAVLGGPSILQDLTSSSNYFTRTYTYLDLSHDHIRFAFSLYAIDKWADYTLSSSVIEVFFDDNPVNNAPQLQLYPSDLCGGLAPDSHIKIFGKASHFGESVTIKIGISQALEFSTGSFAIRDLSLIFASGGGPPPIAVGRRLQGDSGMNSMCGKSTGSFLSTFAWNECHSIEGEYQSGVPGIMCDDSCKSCYDTSNTDCYQCNDGYAFDGNICAPCHSGCKTCSLNPSYCTSCTTLGMFAFQGSCISSCPSPLISISEACSDQCITPCPPAQIAYPNGFCDIFASCAPPLLVNELHICVSPCDPASTEPYVDSRGTCWDVCPSGTTPEIINGIKWCQGSIPDTYQLLDLYGPSPCISRQSTTWSASYPTNPSALTSTCDGNDVLGGLSIFQDLMTNTDNYFSKTYKNINPLHDQIRFAFSLYAIDRWADFTLTSPVIEVFFDDYLVNNAPQIQAYPSNLCGNTGLSDSYIRVFGRASHTGNTATIKIGVSSPMQFSTGSFAIRDLSLLFPSAEISVSRRLQSYVDMNSMCGRGSGPFVPSFLSSECVCIEGEYEGDGCGTCDASCKSCYDSNSNNCYECNDGYAFDGNNCIACDPKCRTCSFNPSYCTSCSAAGEFAYKGDCVTQCPAPLISIPEGCPDQCVPPTCSQYVWIDGTCRDTCEPPLRASGTSCMKPCDDPMVNYHQDTNECKAGCDGVSSLTSDGYLLCSPSTSTEKGSLADILLVAPTEPDTITVITLTKFMQYLRYLDIKLPPRLEGLSVSKGRSVLSLQPTAGLTSTIHSWFNNATMAPLMQRQNLHPKFLANFGGELFILIILFSSAIFFSVLTYISQKLKLGTATLIFEKFQILTRWNLCFMFFATYFDDIILYSTLEFITLNIKGSSAVFSFMVCMGAIVGCLGFMGAIYKIVMKRPVSKVNPSNTATTTTPSTNSSCQIFFGGFKPTPHINKLFFLFYVSRSALPILFAVTISSAPVAQVAMQVAVSVIIIGYALAVRPLQNRINQYQLCLIETTVLIMNIGVLVLTILDSKGIHNTQTAVLFGDLIILGNVAINVLVVVILVLKFIYTGKDIRNLYRKEKTKALVCSVNMLVLPLQQGAFGFEQLLGDVPVPPSTTPAVQNAQIPLSENPSNVISPSKPSVNAARIYPSGPNTLRTLNNRTTSVVDEEPSGILQSTDRFGQSSARLLMSSSQVLNQSQVDVMRQGSNVSMNLNESGIDMGTNSPKYKRGLSSYLKNLNGQNMKNSVPIRESNMDSYGGGSSIFQAHPSGDFARNLDSVMIANNATGLKQAQNGVTKSNMRQNL